MKKFLALVLVLMSLLWAIPAMGITWHTNPTVAWDAPTTLEGDRPIPADNTIVYDVVVADATADPNREDPQFLERVDGTQAQVRLNIEGRFYVGVRSVRLLADGTEAGASEYVWSDDPAVVKNGETFGVVQLFSPNPPCFLYPMGD